MITTDGTNLIIIGPDYLTLFKNTSLTIPYIICNNCGGNQHVMIFNGKNPDEKNVLFTYCRKCLINMFNLSELS